MKSNFLLLSLLKIILKVKPLTMPQCKRKMKNIHILNSKNPSRLHLGGSGLVLCDFVFDKSTINGQHIYITSDEEITGFENNIWVIKGERIFLWQNTMALVSNNKPKKIILTTDQDLIADGVEQISEDTLLKIVEHINSEKNIKSFYEL